MKTPTSILLSSTILETSSEEREKKKKAKHFFQTIFFLWHWEFKDLYEKKMNSQNDYFVFNLRFLEEHVDEAN